MSLQFYVIGPDDVRKYFVRVGFSGTRPLIYAVYNISEILEYLLPAMPGQRYRDITAEQYEWLRNHLNCDVSYKTAPWSDMICDLECRTHREYYDVFASSRSFISDDWDERQV